MQYFGETEGELQTFKMKAFELCMNGHEQEGWLWWAKTIKCLACHAQSCTDQGEVFWLIDQHGGVWQYQTQWGGWLNHIPSLWWGRQAAKRWGGADGKNELKKEQSHGWKTRHLWKYLIRAEEGKKIREKLRHWIYLILFFFHRDFTSKNNCSLVIFKLHKVFNRHHKTFRNLNPKATDSTVWMRYITCFGMYLIPHFCAISAIYIKIFSSFRTLLLWLLVFQQFTLFEIFNFFCLFLIKIEAVCIILKNLKP